MAAFLTGLHAKLNKGSIVTFIDNSESQLDEFPIVRTDKSGNTYQQRVLDDGSTHEVLKNFPREDDLRRAIPGEVTDWELRTLQHFWCASYTISGS